MSATPHFPTVLHKGVYLKKKKKTGLFGPGLAGNPKHVCPKLMAEHRDPGKPFCPERSPSLASPLHGAGNSITNALSDKKLTAAVISTL